MRNSLSLALGAVLLMGGAAVAMWPRIAERWGLDLDVVGGRVDAAFGFMRLDHDGKIRISLNDEASKGTGQIEEYLMEFNGEGIQHIAFACDDLYACWDALKANGIEFMTAPPAAYYEMLEERLPGHGEPIAELQSRGILLDGTTEGDEPRLLLQIFSANMIGPTFFEFIQRKQDEGFGEGNFKALFESIERDQVARGVVATEA